MFANTQMMGMDLAFPDVCLTPLPPPVPVPIPYPNMGLGPAYIPMQVKVLFFFTPAHNMLCFTPLSLGDFTGVMLGVCSATVMGPARHLTAAFTTLVGCMPATRMTSLSLQNSTNMVGMRIVPSQPKVLLLGP